MSWCVWLATTAFNASRAFQQLASVGGRKRSLSSSSLGSSAKKTVFIDGEAGTTGLQVYDRLARHPDVDVVSLPAEQRKDTAKRKEALNSVDAVVLCLPDAAAIEAVALIENEDVKVVDASTAHRCSAEWAYGFPEMTKMQRERIKKSKRVANPGCYATGYLSLTRPLTDAGLMGHMEKLACTAISGYSGGGKALCAVHEGPDHVEPWGAYGLSLDHKHLPEMRVYSRMDYAPLFLPAVGHFKQGMVVSIPLPWGDGPALHEALAAHYADSDFVTVAPLELDELADQGFLNRGAFLDPTKLNGSNNLDVFVFHNPDTRTAVLAARLDNLGKGASGAAVQNINIMLDLDEHNGLDLNLKQEE